MMFPPGMPKAIYVDPGPDRVDLQRARAPGHAGHPVVRQHVRRPPAADRVHRGGLLPGQPQVIGILGSATSFLMTVIITGFEALIQALQAYIFTLLTAVYIAGSLHAEH
jgi:F-type H+-transporting ATPase subunit a